MSSAYVVFHSQGLDLVLASGLSIAGAMNQEAAAVVQEIWRREGGRMSLRPPVVDLIHLLLRAASFSMQPLYQIYKFTPIEVKFNSNTPYYANENRIQDH